MAKKVKQDDIIRILAWGDSPSVATGFANVTGNIFMRIAKNPRFHVDFIGINDAGGWKDPKIYGEDLHMYPAIGVGGLMDIYGRSRIMNAVLNKDLDLVPPWDIIWTLNDPFILEEKVTKWDAGTMRTLRGISDGFSKQFPPQWWNRIISYWPVDSEIKQNWYNEAIALADYSVAYTNYGAEEINKVERQLGGSKLRNPLEIIYHGVDTKIYKPMETDKEKKEVMDFRKKFFQGKVADDAFVVTIVARNQPRKDIPRAMKAFKEFHMQRPNSFLYIHAKNDDAGGTISEFGRMLGMKETEDFGFPGQFSENKGYPAQVLNLLYNMSDCVFATTLGEGFGLPYFEAMATKTINLAPDNTTTPELFNIKKGDTIDKLDDPDYLKQIRGISILSGSNDTEYFSLGKIDKERYRPLTNVDDAVNKLIWIYDNPKKVAQIQDQAYEWVTKNYTWDKVAKQWEDLFISVYDKLQAERMAWRPSKDLKEGDLPGKLKISTGDDENEQSNSQPKD